MLADSYKNAEIISSFTKDGKAYARIKMKCDRCGGRGIFAIGVHNGQLVPAHPDNGICYKCSGSGFAIEEVRDYTEVEYERMQRAKVKRDEAKRVENERRMAERREEHNLRLLNQHGFNGIHAYAIVGNTYELKEELKAHGAKFSYELLWVSPEEPTWLPTDRYVKICVSDVFEMHDDVLCIKDSATSFINSLQPKSGEHLGTIGQRLKVTVTIAKRFEYDTEYVKGWPTTSYKYIMKTDDGNTVTWSTSAVYWKEGYKCAIIGTVKDHAEYKGVRQTVLTRCKEVKDEHKRNVCI